MGIVARTFFRGIRRVLTPVMLIGNRLTRPRGVARPAHEQAEVDASTRRLALYHFPACPFCIKVRRTMDRLSLDVELRDAQPEGEHRRTLEAHTGRTKVPCLRIEHDSGEVEWLAESDDIIAWLEARYGSAEAATG